MEDKTSIRQLIAQISQGAQQSAEVVQGTVTNASPLKITLLNDAKIVLSSTDLIVPKHLTTYTVFADITGGTVTNTVLSHNHNNVTLTINNSLKAGDKVHMLVFNNGKKYFVLDKV